MKVCAHILEIKEMLGEPVAAVTVSQIESLQKIMRLYEDEVVDLSNMTKTSFELHAFI